MQCIIQGRHFKTLQVWFESHGNKREFRDNVDIVALHNNSTQFAESRFVSCSPFYTLRSDISDVDKWARGITKNYMYEIKRACKEKVDVSFYSSRDVVNNPGILDDFNSVYKGMYEQKGLGIHELPVRELQGYAEKDAVLISSATVGDARIFHSYVLDDQNVRLLHSCSLFRGYDNQIRNAVARANKYLHYKDVELFSSQGKRNYDWGGITDINDPNGIDKFKMAFGGTPIQYFSITVYKSLPSKAFILLYRK